MPDPSIPANLLPEQTEENDGPKPLQAGQQILVPLEGTGTVVYQGRQGLGKVALTFDSGWLYEPTETLLDVLDDLDVKATFFTRGGWVQAQPDLTRLIRTRGHEIGNHSYTHSSQPSLEDAEMRWELNATRDALLELVGETEPYYRPPYGEYVDRDVALAGSEGYYFTVMWSKDSIDWTEPGEDIILQRVGNELEDGGIALMHVGVWQTANVLSQVISRLRERGLEPVRLSEILDWANLPMQTITAREDETWESLALDYKIPVEVLISLNSGD